MANMGSSAEEGQQSPKEDITGTLPEEVWYMIFKYLNAGEKQSCYNVSPTSLFREYLAPKKTVWMYDKVLPILFRYLENNTILECRKVCKGWKSSVDKYIQNYPCLRAISPSDTTPYSEHIINKHDLESRKLSETDLEEEILFDRFMSEMKDHPRNPFLNRNVSLQFINDSTFKFLDMFGKHIWYMKMFIITGDVVEYMKNVHGILSRVPNLKELFLYGEYLNAEDVDHMNNEEYENYRLDTGRLLKQYLSKNKCPVLPHLETLGLEYLDSCEFTNEILVNILRDGQVNQIGGLSLSCPMVHLQLDEEHAVQPLEFPWFLHRWYNLTQLAIPISHDDQLHELMESKAPLKMLDIKLNHNVDYKLVATVLHDFRATLQHLEISIVTESWEDDPPCVIPEVATLSNVMHFEITNGLPLVANFIRGLKRLNRLTVHWDFPSRLLEEKKVEQMGKILGASSDPNIHMLESPIWGEIPTLFVCNWESWENGEVAGACTRQMHENHLKEQQEQQVSTATIE